VLEDADLIGQELDVNATDRIQGGLKHSMRPAT
jgi:hypothetical protein